MASTESDSIPGTASKAGRGDKKYSHNSALGELALQGQIGTCTFSRFQSRTPKAFQEVVTARPGNLTSLHGTSSGLFWMQVTETQLKVAWKKKSVGSGTGEIQGQAPMRTAPFGSSATVTRKLSPLHLGFVFSPFAQSSRMAGNF